MTKFVLATVLFASLPLVSFADCPQPTACQAYTYAQDAAQVYNNGPVGTVGCDAASIPSVSSDGQGFYAAVYGNATTGYVLAFRGTQGTQDWIDDFDQGLNGNNIQFAEARSYFEAVENVMQACGTSLTIVGHSLGGALAQYAAATPGYNCCAVTFNPAALLPNGTGGDSSQVHNYVNGDDILHDIVNPLLAQVEKTDPTHVASGYIGTDTYLGSSPSPYNFSNVNLTAADLQELQNLLSDLENEDYLGAAGDVAEISGNAHLWSEIEQILQDISPNLSTSFQKLCNDYHQGNLLTLPGDWSTLQNNFQTVIGPSANAHLMGTVVSNNAGPNGEPQYTSGSMLDLLQGQCNQQLGISGTSGSSGGNNGGNGPGSNYPTVPGGCFGNQPSNDGMPPDFLDLMGQMVDAAGSQAGQDALGNASDALDVLKQFTDLAKTLNLPDASTLEGLGQYTGPLGDVLQILSIGGQLAALENNCMTALASGSEQDFVNAINTAAQSAVSAIVGQLGQMGGAALGGAGGTAIGGPIGEILGGFAGGWLGGQAGEAAGNWLYTQFMQNWVTTNIAEKLFDLLCPGNSGGGGITLPPANPPGNGTGNGGSSNGNSGQPDAGISNPSQIINSGTDGQQEPPPEGPGYERNQGYRQLSK